MTTIIDFPRCDRSTRALHLVDIENLLGEPRAGADAAMAVFDRYLALSGWRPGDLVSVAANPGLARDIAWRLPSWCSLRTARGQDAADELLLAHAAPEFVARRAGRLVIGSGDHIFGVRADAARRLGVDVTIVSRPESLASRWRRGGHHVVAFDLARPAAALAA